ncbi:MAG: SH3 domain-containing protein [Rhodoferax sp.]|nr:SH3 domain-containing protein [Rhodoferax sp.]
MIQRTLPKRTAFTLALLLAASAHAQTDTLTIKRPSELRDGPSDAARSVAALPLQTQVTRLGQRQGPWIEVRTAQGASGWVHMFDVGMPPAAQGSSTTTGALRGITSFFGKGNSPAATTTGTATVGIRGLGAEDIANAQPNLEAVARAEGMRQDSAQARLFASSAALTAQAVVALPVPALPTRASAGTGQAGTGAPSSGGTDR